MTTQNIPNWKKGDIICLLNIYDRVESVFEAEHDPYYGKTILSSVEDWYYGLRNSKEIRLATIEDIDCEIKIKKEEIKRKQADLDRLLNFRERLSK